MAAPVEGQGGRGLRIEENAADGGQVRRAGAAVDPGDAVEQESSGEGAEQEVFQSRLVVALVVAQVAGQDVGGDGRDLDADEDHDQLIGRGHEALADDGEQNQGVVFASLVVGLAEVIGRHQNDDRADGQDEHAEEGGEAVNLQQAVEGGAGIGGAEHGEAQRREQGDEGDDGQNALARGRGDRFQDHQQRARGDQQELRARSGRVRRRRVCSYRASADSLRRFPETGPVSWPSKVLAGSR